MRQRNPHLSRNAKGAPAFGGSGNALIDLWTDNSKVLLAMTR
jgi:hypothetical protein